MKEELLHYLWQFRYFNHANLRTTSGDDLAIIHTGTLNTDQGPDFINARIRVNDTVWAGTVELHLRSSLWNVHRHTSDPHFNNVILHVVWQHDKEVVNARGEKIMTLELQNRVSKLLIGQYRRLMAASRFIPCEGNRPDMNELVLQHWKQRLVIERILQKSRPVLESLQRNHNHWEETFWRHLAATFGLKVNAGFFRKVAASLPLPVIIKHADNLTQVEALLFGQAGLLDKNFKDAYPQMLKKEYEFYKKKYNLVPPEGKLSLLRMRPANFPTIRLAQLAALVCQRGHLFSTIKEAASLSAVTDFFRAGTQPYWNDHYMFDKAAPFKVKSMGSTLVNNILINAIIPVLFSYGMQQQEEAYKDSAVEWLQEMKPEKNVITKGFEKLGYRNLHAWDSQAFIQLKNEYCDQKRCLQCAIGDAILKAGSSAPIYPIDR